MAVSMVLILVSTVVYYTYSVRLIEKSVQTEMVHLQETHVALFEQAYLGPLRNTLAMMSISPLLRQLLLLHNLVLCLSRLPIAKVTDIL